jgi:hypothetical protein
VKQNANQHQVNALQQKSPQLLRKRETSKLANEPQKRLTQFPSSPKQKTASVAATAAFPSRSAEQSLPIRVKIAFSPRWKKTRLFQRTFMFSVLW